MRLYLVTYEVHAYGSRQRCVFLATRALAGFSRASYRELCTQIGLGCIWDTYAAPPLFAQGLLVNLLRRQDPAPPSRAELDHWPDRLAEALASGKSRNRPETCQGA
jgi:hypothetical protein